MSFVASSTAPGVAARWLLAACLAGLAALPAHAADQPAKKKEVTLGKAKPGLPMLTKEQLRSCLSRNDSIKGRMAAVLPEQAALKKEGDDLAQAGQALNADRATLDSTKEDVVKGFNERVVEREKAVEAYKARSEAYNAKVDALQADKTAYLNDCDGRTYFEDEEAQIRKGK
jgi:hypothetical protein